MSAQEMLLAIGCGLWAIGLLLLRLPTKCPHDCGQCRLDQQRREAEDDQRQHDYLHRTYGEANCPRCQKQ